MKKSHYPLSFLIAISALLTSASMLHAEGITLTSYYPSPSGAYDRLRLVPQAEINEACETGSLYYLTGDTLRVCDNTGAYVPISPWVQTNSNIYPVETASNPNLKAGIGTQTPLFRLSLDTGAAKPDGGIWAEGTFGSGATVGNPGPETRLLWYPRKAAFRAGGVSDSQWDDANIGNYSVAFGYATTANGNHSTAMGNITNANGMAGTAFGYQTTAFGDYSTAMGNITNATGNYSTAIGYATTANGDYSTAIGGNTTANGDYSTATGYYTYANGLAGTATGNHTYANGLVSTAIGEFTTADGDISTAIGYAVTAQAFASTVVASNNIITGDPNTWIDTDPLFVVGNGIASDTGGILAPSNALIVLKNGSTGINLPDANPKPEAALHINSVMKLEPLASAPSVCPADDLGLLYVNDTGTFCFCDGSAWWIVLGTGSCS